MKKLNRIILLVFCMLFLVMIGSASAQKCICYDENGNPYGDKVSGDTLCYQYSDGGLVKSQSLTLQQCRAINAAQAQKEAEEAARKQKEAEEAARKQREAEEAARRQQEAEEAARRQREAEEAARRQQEAEEAARRQREAEEAARRQQEAEEAARRQQEAEEAARRQQEAEEAARRQQEAEEAARRQQEAEEAARKQQEAEEAARRQQEAEEAARRQQEAEEAARKQQEAEEAARRQQEAEEAARKQQEAEEAARKQQEAEVISQNAESGQIPAQEPAAPGFVSEAPIVNEKQPEAPIVNEQQPEAPIADENQPEAPIVNENQPEAPIVNEQQPEAPIADENQPEAPIVNEKQPEAPIADENQPEAPVADENQPETPIADENQPETPIAGENQPEAPIADENQPEEPIADENQPEESVADENQPEEPVADENQTEEPAPDVKQTEEPAPDEKPTDEPVKKGPAISIEGKLDNIGLSTPDGGTFTTAAVPFEWVYTVSDSNPIDVDFSLTLVIDDHESGQKTTSTTVVSSASCENFICNYTAGSELSGFKQADVTWSVSGTFDDGGSATTIGSNPAQKSFKLDVKEPTPKPTPKPKPTPTPKPTPKPKPAPKAPVQECPIGRYIVRSLGFYWAPSKNAQTYTVKWRNDRHQEGTLTLSNSDKTCQKGRCIAYATLPGVGNYVWTVTASNKSGSATSGEMHFEIASNISIPTAYSPNGTIVNRVFPSFQWEDVQDGATAYRIQVVGKYDNRIRLDSWYPVKDIYVGNGVCYVKTDLFLPAGSYSWRVQAKNDDFRSGWSSWLDFYVECDYCSYNNNYTYQTYTNTVPRTSYPTGVITKLTPEFQWQTLTGASYYLVKLTDSAGKQIFDRQVSSSSCSLELCSFNPGVKLPGNGTYYWTVSGYGSGGGLWGSANGSFEVRAAVVMNPIIFISPEPNGYLSQDSPIIIWSDPGETTVLFSMEIHDRNNNMLFRADLSREQAWCDGTTCSVAFQTIPDAEGYKITLTPYSELNTTGEQVSLTFNKGFKPITVTSPKDGSVVQARPMFRWTLENGAAAEYELLLIDENNSETIFSPLVCGMDGVNCEGGEAFFSPAELLPSGTYTASLGVSGVGSVAVFGFTVE